MMKALKITGEDMKKQILSALILTALSAPTLTHPIALKTAFDMGMFLTNLIMTPEILASRGAPIPEKIIWTNLLVKPAYVKPAYEHLPSRHQDPTYKKSLPLSIVQVGLYVYTVSGLWKAYKEHKNSGTIQVKTTRG